MNQRYEARLLCPGPGGDEEIPGTISVDRFRIRFASAGVSFDIPLDRVELEFLPSMEGPVTFDDPTQPGRRCYTLDAEILSEPALTKSSHVREQLQRILGRRELFRRLRLTLYAALGCVVAAWVISLIVSGMVNVAVNRLPAEWERKMGDKEMDTIRKHWTFVDDTNRVAELQALAVPLLRVVPLGREPVRFFIVEEALPNAFALPGGYVVVTTGMLRDVERPEQLLGVMAHELAHVSLKHGFRHMISSMGPIFVLQIFLSNRNSQLDILSQSSGLLINRGFSQQYEREADATGWSYLVAANIDPRGLIEVLEQFKAYPEGDPAFSAFRSHPALNQRIEWLQSKWRSLPRHDGFLDITNRIPGRRG